MNDLLANLQRLGDAEIDDLSVAHDAISEIVELRLVKHDLLDALQVLTGMAEAFSNELHKNHPDVIAARAAIAKATGGQA